MVMYSYSIDGACADLSNGNMFRGYTWSKREEHHDSLNLFVAVICCFKISFQGDSGSPLVCYTARGVVLVGITSWGSASCRNYPTVFTAVAPFTQWIDMSIKLFRRNRRLLKDAVDTKTNGFHIDNKI